jgi:hypothetical protein
MRKGALSLLGALNDSLSLVSRKEVGYLTLWQTTELQSMRSFCIMNSSLFWTMTALDYESTMSMQTHFAIPWPKERYHGQSFCQIGTKKQVDQFGHITLTNNIDNSFKTNINLYFAGVEYGLLVSLTVT